MSRSLQGYTTIDKSLTGIITISDGGGTTISQGNIVCDTITANSTNFPSYYPEYFTATDNNRTDSGLYRILFTGDSNDQPHPFILNSTFRFRPSTQELFCVASNIYVDNDLPGMIDFHPLLFAERNTSNGSRSVKQSLDFLYYQPSTQKLFVNNLDFTGNLNGVSTSFFSDIPKISLLYDALGGNNTLGPTLPTWSDTYKEISFPTNVWILGTLTTALPAVFTNQSNLFNYPVHEGDANFNSKGYLQISIESDGTTTSAGIAGIDFGSWNGRTNASSRIYARDDANSSSDLYFVTAPSGSITSVPVPRMVIKADGFIGIGNTDPAHALHVTGEIRCTNRVITDKITSTTNGNITFDTYPTGVATERMVIMSGGNVGIRNTNPAHSLHVTGDIRCTDRLICDKLTSTTNANIAFDTYPSGVATERMRINSNGNVGIGTTAVPSYRLDVNGQGRFVTGVLTNTLISTNATTASSIMSDKTTGAINIGGGLILNGNVNIGNITGGLNSVNLYGKTFCYGELQANQGIDCNSYEPLDPNLGLTIGTSMGAGNGTISIGTSGTTTNNMNLNALTGTLNGNWNSPTPTTGDNSTKIATTAFVQNTLSAGSFLALNSTTTQVVNSTVGFIGRLGTGSALPYNVVGSGSLQHDNVICSDDGEIVYTFGNSSKILYGSFDSGITFRALYTHPSTTTINNIACNGSGKYIFISFASQAFQYSFNFGNTFQAISIPAITTYYPITQISCSFEVTGNFYVGVTNNNTALSRVDIYVSTTGPTGTFTAGNLPGNTSNVLSHCFSNTNMLISVTLGIEVWANPSPYNASLTQAGNVVFASGGGILAKIRSNNGGNFVQVGASDLYQSRQFGLTGYVSASSDVTRAVTVNKNGTIFLYASLTKLYISNNQYSQKITVGSTLPVYTLLLTASGNITDVYISGNGLKCYYTVEGQLDRIYQFDINGPTNFYQGDFVVDKDRCVVRSHAPADITGNFANALLPYKITMVGGDFTIAQPFTQYYQLNGTANFTITLPRITEFFIGLEFKLFHTQSKTVTINCDTNDMLIHPKAALVLTDTTYAYAPGTNFNGISVMATYSPGGTKMFAWVFI